MSRSTNDRAQKLRLLFLIISALIVIPLTGIWIQKFLVTSPSIFEYLDDEKQASLSLYQKYDRNFDGYIDFSEFEAIAFRIKNSQLNQDFYNIPISHGDEYISLIAYFDPINLESMSKGKSIESLFTDTKALKFLKEWKSTYVKNLNLPVKSFSSFIPNDRLINPGDIWELIPIIKNDRYIEHLSNNRYQPPDLNSQDEIVLFKILQMFHKNPFLYSRFPPQGTGLYLRAFNDEYYDILFRIHAEYQINELPYFPFWFTPASFNGRIIISKDMSHIEYFQLHVPNDKKLNVDMEWLNDMKDGEQNMEVDIGYMPRMEVISSQPSIVLSEENPMKFHEQTNSDLNKFKWTEEIDIEIGFDKLEKHFYPFKQIKYHKYLDAFEHAKKLNKFVHFIMLWGALDDQSC